ncbi:hypothetical protein VZ95_18740, partial [Elstera litoralis]
QHGVNGTPETLRTYLHRCGVIFYDPHIYQDRIIIDQAWALGAIYTLFDRKKVYERLRAQYGRFTLADLSDLVWDAEGFSPDEQRLFLSFMKTCGICFVYQGTGAETIYLAPDLLPEQSAFDGELGASWDSFPGQLTAITYDYNLLHRGIMRALICRIGEEAQMHGRYWRDGLFVYEKKTHSRACIRQIPGKRDGHTTATPWAGCLTLEVKNDPDGWLFRLLRGWIEEINHTFGVKDATPHDAPPLRPDAEETFKPTFAEEPMNDDKLSAPGQNELTTGPEKEPMSDYKLYVSYCWKDLTKVPETERANVEKIFGRSERKKNQNLKRYGEYKIRRKN